MSDVLETTGADIVGALLRASTIITAKVLVQSIKGGRLPDGVVLPAFLVRTVDSIERQTLRRQSKVRVVDRVSVTVRAERYDDQVNLIGAARRACAGRTGNIAGAESVSILSAGKGPDLLGPGDSFEQTQDFRVSFDTAA